MDEKEKATAHFPVIGISVTGFKSIDKEQSIELRPLTILAGANSSGKSSIMQPALLMKQTLDATYDPGALLLDGPNVRVTSAEQILSRNGEKREFEVHFLVRQYLPLSVKQYLPIGLGEELGWRVGLIFDRWVRQGFDVKEIVFTPPAFSTAINPHPAPIRFRTRMSDEEIKEALKSGPSYLSKHIFHSRDVRQSKLMIVQDRCFLWVAAKVSPTESISYDITVAPVRDFLKDFIHIPGLRGNPHRSYKRTSAGPTFPGTFENYTASVISQWEKSADQRLQRLSESLTHLDLTSRIKSEPINDAEIEVHVGRLPGSPEDDFVNIADAGVGVSQALPVLVALLAAKPGQTVYVEEPENHLHPRAQVAMAKVLCDAAKRGVQVITEIHSPLLLLGIQTQVAEGHISPDLIKLHWFERDEKGSTTITSAEMDEAGAYGNWPMDFGDVELTAQNRYLDAAELRLSERAYVKNDGNRRTTMTLKERVTEEMKKALKEKDQVRLDCLRMAKGAILLKEKESSAALTDEMSSAALRSEINKRRQSIEIFRQHGKEAEAVATEKEIAIFEEFLPKQLSAEETESRVRAYVAEHPEMNHPGKLTGAMKKELGDLADGKVLNEICRKVLGA